MHKSAQSGLLSHLSELALGCGRHGIEVSVVGVVVGPCEGVDGHGQVLRVELPHHTSATQKIFSQMSLSVQDE